MKNKKPIFRVLNGETQQVSSDNKVVSNKEKVGIYKQRVIYWFMFLKSVFNSKKKKENKENRENRSSSKFFYSEKHKEHRKH